MKARKRPAKKQKAKTEVRVIAPEAEIVPSEHWEAGEGAFEPPVKIGRPTKYEPQYDEMVLKMARLGISERQMSNVLGVTEQTLNNWKRDNPSFLESLREGKEPSDACVAQSLYNRAIGSVVYEEKVGKDGGTYTLKREIPPDTAAASLWLRNRQPKLWRDKIHVDQETNVVLTLRDYTGREHENQIEGGMNGYEEEDDNP